MMGSAESIAVAASAEQPVGDSKLLKAHQSAIGIAMLLSVFAIFVSFGLHGMTDAKYSMLVSENLLRRHSLVIDERSMPRREPSALPGYTANGYPYQIEVRNGKRLYRYPVGSSVLSIPIVVLMNIFGISAHTPDGAYNEDGERDIQRALAALLMAVLTVVFFRTALLLLPLSWSVVLALGGGFSTQIWSTASRVLWSHTWQILLLGLTIYMLLAQEERQDRGRPVVLATLLSWAYFVRPTSSIPIIAVSAYMLIFRRREFAALAITGAAWMAVFVACSWKLSGQPIPSYYLFHLSSRHLWEALAGDLVSPSRGLFVYVPGSAFALLLVAYYWRELSHRRLAVLSLSVITVHLFVVSTDPNWWGGHCYGARLMTDVIPWFFLLAILGSRCLVGESPSRLKHLIVALGLLSLVVGAAMNERGALSQSANDWVNGPPEDVDQKPARVWDWSNPQFLSELRFMERHRAS
jgi:hypothetical protein